MNTTESTDLSSTLIDLNNLLHNDVFNLNQKVVLTKPLSVKS